MENIFETIERLEQKISKIMEAEETPKGNEKGEERIDFDSKIGDADLEEFVDGLLTTLGELELKGRFKIDGSSEARDALMAVIRQLYLRKSLIAKNSRKFARWGAKQFLRRQKTELGRAL